MLAGHADAADLHARRAPASARWCWPTCSTTTPATGSTASSAAAPRSTRSTSPAARCWPAAGPAPGCGSAQRKMHAARGAHRLHLLGHRRGVRAAGLRAWSCCSTSRSCVAVLVRLVDEENLFTVLAATGPRRAVRRAGVRQHPRQPAAVPVEGHDAAAGQLRRLVDHRPVLPRRPAAGDHPAQSRSSAARGSTWRGALERQERACGEPARSRHYVLAAGGTGGHLTPAFALAHELERRGHHVALITDERGAEIPGKPDFLPAHVLPAGRFGKNPLRLAQGRSRAVLEGRRMALRLFESFEPSAVVGFGGYPALPALLAARTAGIAVGDPRAERGARPGQPPARRAGRCDRHRLSRGRPAASRSTLDKVHLVGNPVRPQVLALRDEPFPAFTAGRPAARAGDRRQPGRAGAVRGRARRPGDAPAGAALAGCR